MALKTYSQSSAVTEAEKRKKAAENAVSAYGDFQYKNQAAYDKALDSILNRKQFKYDINTDALYNQYKDRYMQAGKRAMQDTIGQASALTGGYGNSYATAAGAQAYNDYLGQLNDAIPVLYQMALDRYNTEGNQLANNLSAISADRAQAYSEWGDRLNRLATERGYYGDDYNNAYARDYGAFRDSVADEQFRQNFDESVRQYNENRAYQQARDTVADSQWQKNYDESVRQYNENRAYQQARDAIDDEQWRKNFEESIRQYNANMAENKRQFDAQMAYKATSGGSSGSSSSGDSTGLQFVTPVKSDNTSLFQASVRTKHEFARSGNADKTKYGTYDNYLMGTILKWMDEKKINEGEAQYLVDYYKLGG